MPPNSSTVRAQLSVLDRLLDDEPKVREEVPLTSAQSVRQLKAALRRDLEFLLNSRSTTESTEDFAELSESVFTYGLADFSTTPIGAAQVRVKLRRELARSLELFEPRLNNVEVTTVDTKEDAGKRNIRFVITGLLRMDPVPEEVSFETTLEVNRGDFSIRED